MSDQYRIVVINELNLELNSYEDHVIGNRSQTPNKKASWLLERAVRNLHRKTATCFGSQVLMKQQICWNFFYRKKTMF